MVKKLDALLLQDLSLAVDELFCEYEDKSADNDAEDEITRPVMLPSRLPSARGPKPE